MSDVNMGSFKELSRKIRHRVGRIFWYLSDRLTPYTSHEDYVSWGERKRYVRSVLIGLAMYCYNHNNSASYPQFSFRSCFTKH